MSQSSIALPPGATLESNPAAMALPPGATLETNSADQGEGSFADILDRAYGRFKKALSGDIPLTDYDAATLSGVASVARGTGHAIEGVANLLKPPSWDELKQAVQDSPQNPATAILARRMGKGVAQTAKQATEVPAAVHDINASPDPLGTYAKAGQETLGDLAGQAITTAATEGARVGVGKAADLAADPAAQAAVKAGAKQAAKSAIKHIPYAGKVAGDVFDAARTAYNEAKAAPAPAAVENPALTSESRTLPGQIGPERIYGPRPTPAQPIPARPGLALTGEVAAPAAEAPKPTAAAPEPAPAKPITRAEISNTVDQAFGLEKPPQPVRGVPLRNQAAAQAAAAGELPEGFTPAPKSSALRGYKYDPAAEEFDAITKDGQRYRHAGITQDQFDKFEASDSKGAAWGELRNGPGVTPLGKVDATGKLIPRIKPHSETFSPVTDLDQEIKGGESEPAQASPERTPATDLSQTLKKAPKRTIVKDPTTGRPEFSDVVAKKQAKPTPASEGGAEPGSLLDQMQASLDLQKKGAVQTTAVPGDLLKRWGVDEESLTAGREQTRGMSPQETAASVDKLVARYKRLGPKAVDPIVETRDAGNNIISVDGRARALAAHKAGIERIPIIVRRLPAQAAQ